MKGALGVSCSPVAVPPGLEVLEGVGGGETYSEPSQQVEVTGESFTHHDHRVTVVTTAPRWRKERPLTLGLRSACSGRKRMSVNDENNRCSVFRGKPGRLVPSRLRTPQGTKALVLGLASSLVW